MGANLPPAQTADAVLGLECVTAVNTGISFPCALLWQRRGAFVRIITMGTYSTFSQEPTSLLFLQKKAHLLRGGLNRSGAMLYRRFLAGGNSKNGKLGSIRKKVRLRGAILYSGLWYTEAKVNVSTTLSGSLKFFLNVPIQLMRHYGLTNSLVSENDPAACQHGAARLFLLVLSLTLKNSPSDLA